METEDGKETDSRLRNDDRNELYQDIGATVEAENEPAHGSTFADMQQISAEEGLNALLLEQADVQAVDSISNDAVPLDLLRLWW